MKLDRIIGRYEGEEKGPLLICLGGLHGNEPAGVEALNRIFKALETEPEVNEGFHFYGKMVGIRGNLQALEAQTRFLECDLNRIWKPEIIESVRKADKEQLKHEYLELRELLDTVWAEIEAYPTDKIVVLDLHTTTAAGGLFIITPKDAESERIAKGIHAPIVRGILEGESGTTLHYFNTENIGIPTNTVVFEAGQHDDPESIDYAYSALVNCLRAIGCVQSKYIEARHDNLLIKHSKKFPKITKLIHHHLIEPGANFKMKPGFKNFQPIRKGTILATDKNGNILAPYDGLMLMPLYQPQGEDGYFLIEIIDE